MKLLRFLLLVCLPVLLIGPAIAQPLHTSRLQLPEQMDGLLTVRSVDFWKQQLQQPVWKSLSNRYQLAQLLEQAKFSQTVKNVSKPVGEALQLTDEQLLEAISPADVSVGFALTMPNLIDPIIVLEYPNARLAQKSARQLFGALISERSFTAGTPHTLKVTENISIQVLLNQSVLLCTRTPEQMELALKLNPQLGVRHTQIHATGDLSELPSADWGDTQATDHFSLQLKLPSGWLENLAGAKRPADPGKRFFHDRMNGLRHCTLAASLSGSQCRMRVDLLQQPLGQFRSPQPPAMEEPTEDPSEPLLLLLGGMLNLDLLQQWFEELESHPDDDLKMLHQVVGNLLGTDRPVEELKQALGENWQLQLVEQKQDQAPLPVAMDLMIARSSSGEDSAINSATWDGLMSQLAGLMVVAGQQAKPAIDLQVKRDWDLQQQSLQTFVVGNPFYQVAALVSPLSVQISWGREDIAPQAPQNFSADGIMQVQFTRIANLLNQHHQGLADKISQFTRQETEATNSRLERLAALIKPLGVFQSQWIVREQGVRFEAQLSPSLSR